MTIQRTYDSDKYKEFAAKREAVRDMRKALRDQQREVLRRIAPLEAMPLEQRDFGAEHKLWREYRDLVAQETPFNRRIGYYDGRINALLGNGTKREMISRARTRMREEEYEQKYGGKS